MYRNTIIIGNPGCGKTELSKQLAIDDVEDGLKILIIDSFKEYGHKFLNYDSVTIDIHDCDSDMDFEFKKAVNIISLDNISAKSKDGLLMILIKAFEYAEIYKINTVYVDDLVSDKLLENINNFYEYRDKLKVVTITQSLLQFNDCSAIRSFFKDIVVMKLGVLDIECLKDNYYVKKHSLNESFDCNAGDFTLYNLD